MWCPAAPYLHLNLFCSSLSQMFAGVRGDLVLPIWVVGMIICWGHSHLDSGPVQPGTRGCSWIGSNWHACWPLVRLLHGIQAPNPVSDAKMPQWLVALVPTPLHLVTTPTSLCLGPTCMTLALTNWWLAFYLVRISSP